MKGKIIFFSLLFFMSANELMAQNRNLPKMVINSSAAVRRYYEQKELKAMNKGELIELYKERIKVLVKTLPYIALATKPGVTMADLGIPEDDKNKKLFDLQEETTKNFLDVTIDFQTQMLPYSDKENIVNSILFYESTLKALHSMNDL